MLAKLLKRRGKRTSDAAIPAGKRVYAIGDIHGCDDLLARLLERIDADDAARGLADTTIVLLGDLVDRGPASAQVVKRLHRLAQDRPRIRFLMGNHEEVFLAALDGDAKALRMFTRIGGRETLLSYGIAVDDYDRADYDDLARLVDTHVPRAHRDFLAGFEDMIVIGGYAFVHAGIRPNAPLDDQRATDLRWIREAFLDHSGKLEKLIVHGHTISDDVEERAHRIGIDTGAYATGKLTAIGLESSDRWYLST